MPVRGFAAMFVASLDHPMIEVRPQTGFEQVRDAQEYRRMIFTGPINEFFGHSLGKLPYRSLRFDHETFDQEWLQPVGVVNYPGDAAYTRVTEYKHLTGQTHPQTSITYEYPSAEGDPYYPIPRPEAAVGDPVLPAVRAMHLLFGLATVPWVGALLVRPRAKPPLPGRLNASLDPLADDTNPPTRR